MNAKWVRSIEMQHRVEKHVEKLRAVALVEAIYFGQFDKLQEIWRRQGDERYRLALARLRRGYKESGIKIDQQQ